MKNQFYLLASSLVLAGGTAHAVPAADDTGTTITVTGAPLARGLSAPSVSVVDAATIDAVQGPDLARVLERLPGVAIARNGGVGSATSLFVRGGDSDQLLVLIDGVRIADLASPGGNYDTGPLNLLGVERVELLRGSNSVVWGSQAMSGVLAITTREASGIEASTEYGAYNTSSSAARVGLANDAYALSLNGGYVRSDGIAPKVGDSFTGALDAWNLGGKGRIRLGESLTLRAVARYADTRLVIDQFGQATQRTHDTSGAVALDYAAGPLSLSASASLADVRRHYETAFGPSSFYGLDERLALVGKLALPGALRLDFGADHEWDRAYSTFDSRAVARIDSGHALLGYYSPGFTLAAGGRVDSHDRFGTHWTGGANTLVALGAGLSARAAYGEGFKAPSLYQLYGGFVGNAALKPETSRSYEAGLEWGRRTGTFASATWFRRDSRNLIDLDSSFVYGNVAAARAVGVELEGGVHPTPALALAANYTWLSASDLQHARALARRPRNSLNVSADWQTPLAGLSLGGDLRAVSSTVDYNFAGTALPIGSHVTATLRAAYAISQRFELFARVENLGDVNYQTAYGYNTPGRSAYVGLRLRK